MRKRINWRLIGLILVVYLSTSSVIVMAQEAQVTKVKGVSYIQAGDLVKARKMAINDGLRLAVEQVVGTYINAQTKTKNYQIINDNILKSSQGYVKSYQVLNEYIEDENYYVELEVNVGTKDLTKDLEALQLNIKRHGNPRIMILLKQQIEYETISNIVETEMIKEFLKAGYQVIDRHQIDKVVGHEKKKAILAGDILLAAKLGEQLQADLVVVGQANASYVNLSRHLRDSSLAGLTSYHSQIEAKVIKSSTAEIVTATTGSGKAVGVNKEAAANKSLITATRNISATLITGLSRELIQESKMVNLKIIGISSLQELKELKDKLPRLSGVEESYFREYNSGLAVFDLDLVNTTEILDLVLELDKSVDFPLEMKQISNSKLTLEVKEG